MKRAHRRDHIAERIRDILQNPDGIPHRQRALARQTRADYPAPAHFFFDPIRRPEDGLETVGQLGGRHGRER
jgi:hypothetical protein